MFDNSTIDDLSGSAVNKEEQQTLKELDVGCLIIMYSCTYENEDQLQIKELI